jgi:hypothetical protein
MADTAKTCFLIVGLPRSGTSSIAQFLDNLGVYIGDPSHFLDTAKLKHNPIFYELQWINDFNDRVIGVWGFTYEQDVMPVEADFDRPEIAPLRADLRNKLIQEFGDRPTIGIKDPRICFTFPLWRDVLTDLGYTVKTVLALRAPSAIMKSNRALMPGRLSRWQRFFARHLLAVRYFTRDVTVSHFDYDLLMRDPLNYGCGKAQELGLLNPDPLRATAHLSSAHYHHHPNDAGTGDPWVDHIDSKLRSGQLDPNEYLEYRSIAMLFVADLDEQDKEIRHAIAQKDSYIQAVEEHNKEAARTVSATAQHAANLQELRRISTDQIGHLQAELARVQRELKICVEEGQARADALASVTHRLNELQTRRMVRLMHLIDRAGGRRVSKRADP